MYGGAAGVLRAGTASDESRYADTATLRVARLSRISVLIASRLSGDEGAHN